MITCTKRLLLTCTILGLLAANALTLTSTAFDAALSGLTSTAPGAATVTDTLQSKIAKQDKAIKKRKTATRKFGNRLTARTNELQLPAWGLFPEKPFPCWALDCL